VGRVSDSGVAGWDLAVRAASPVVVRRPVMPYPRPVVVAPTPHACRHANRVVRRAWRCGW